MTEGIAVRGTGFRRAPCIPYLVVVSLSYPDGPRVIVGITAKIVVLKICLARDAPSRVEIRSTGCRDREKPRNTRAKGRWGWAPGDQGKSFRKRKKEPTSSSVVVASSEARACAKAAALVVRAEPSKSERHDVGWSCRVFRKS